MPKNEVVYLPWPTALVGEMLPQFRTSLAKATEADLIAGLEGLEFVTKETGLDPGLCNEIEWTSREVLNLLAEKMAMRPVEYFRVLNRLRTLCKLNQLPPPPPVIYLDVSEMARFDSVSPSEAADA